MVPADDLTDEQFREISSLVKRLCGINLHDGKRQLVRARLTRRLRELGLPDFASYFEYLRHEGNAEIVALMDAISTNLTRFFREPVHFDLLADFVSNAIASGRTELRIWSAGCSSGEEPYSVAVMVHEELGADACRDIRILATDISTRMLAQAREAVYDAERLTDVSPGVLSRHFVLLPDGRYRVADHVRRLVRFARLNLMDPWPMRGPFDAILCRNVMIYFDKPTQQGLIDRFTRIMRPGGLLLIGHSESLSGVRHQLRYVQPTVYVRPEMMAGDQAA